MKTIRVRFAPSPTGYLHIGGLRTALYDYLFARKTGGKCILRIEDTDQSREVSGAAEMLINTLHELGIDFDESPVQGGEFGPYIQSERLELYRKHADELVRSNHAYHCFCSPDTLQKMREDQQARGEFVKYDRRCLELSKEEVQAKLSAGESSVIRLKMPDNRRFGFDDVIRGHVEMDASQSDDQVLIKSDGFPTYHLAATVDDHYMQISHVIRGEEWLSSTPKHIWLYECLGWDAPQWVHLPLILNTDRSKLSKRMNDVSVDSYLQKGYLKEALLNFVALLGWHSVDDRELYTLDELCEAFDLERVNKAGAIFDLSKLDWMNGQYLRSLPLETVAERALPWFDALDIKDIDTYHRIISAARERCTLLPELAEYSKMFLSPTPICEKDLEFIRCESSQKVLRWYVEALVATTESEEAISELANRGIAELGIKGKNFYLPLRLALIGQQHGPDMFTTVSILGKDEAVKRLSAFLLD
ncbi:MAG: glutamate--tRNA ligase [Candidatus Cloacimonetes bacterium]|jgi:glutamyl-tRNA synthetase|nr:glutamate--tRNA ligase [Candidatus Cloacimonadota bacterium]MDD2506433.1 glutamate--tRNA ligase [Candidatus Cloacimonadota bacterium]MDD4147187.1 glutamate--tRNA ligase [Candidatus Cloacimonadota bacterium]MDD4559754.1 glutamate--tRNA ligase [Candidatus Cloacimonadota bacterium]